MMKGKKHLVGLMAAVNVISFFAAVNVMAEEKAAKMNYTQFKAGMVQPTGDQDDADFDTGGNFSAAYGRYLTDFLVLEGGIDVFASEQDLNGANAYAGEYRQDNVLAGAALLVTLKGEYSVGPVDLFGGVGGGIYAVTLDSEIESSRLGDFNADDSDGVFGAHVLIGANYNINERFFVGMEAKYRVTDEVEIRETVASIPVEYQGDLNGYVVTVNAGFRF